MSGIGVMGASGQLGRRIVAELLKHSSERGPIVAIARTPQRIQHLGDLGAELRQADYDDEASMRAAFAGVEHLLLVPSTAAVEPRILQHRQAVNAAQAAGVKRLLFAGLSTGGFPDSKFLISPFLSYAEMTLRQSGLEWTILRNNLYLDPLLYWLPELIEMGELPYPIKDGRAAFVPREDLARASAAACLGEDLHAKIFELSGPQALTMPELAAALADAAGKPISFKSVSDAEYADVCRKGAEEVSDGMIKILTSIYHAVDNGEFANATDDIKQLTGSAAQDSATWLKREWFKMNQNK